MIGAMLMPSLHGRRMHAVDSKPTVGQPLAPVVGLLTATLSIVGIQGSAALLAESTQSHEVQIEGDTVVIVFDAIEKIEGPALGGIEEAGAF